MRESRKTAYTDELRRRSVSDFPNSKQYMPGGSSGSMLGRYGSMRDNPIDLEREAMRAQKQFEKTRDTGATMTDAGTFRKSGNKQKRLKDMFSNKSFEEVGQSICK